MEIEINYNESVDKNASNYFEKSKKLKNKNKKIIEVLEKSKKQLAKLMKLEKEDKDKFELEEKQNSKQKNKKTHWYDKYKLFLTSNNKIIVLGTDQTSNDILIKKYVMDTDTVFHTELAGSGYGVMNKNNFDINIDDFKSDSLLSSENKVNDEEKINFEICQFVAIFSKAGKGGLVNPAVFSMKKTQMLTSSPEGISLPKGAFYIKGKKTYYNYQNEQYGLGLFGRHTLWAPLSTLENHGVYYIILKSGNKKPNELAKSIIKTFKQILPKEVTSEMNFSVDEVIKYIPQKKLDIDNYFIKKIENQKARNNKQ